MIFRKMLCGFAVACLASAMSSAAAQAAQAPATAMETTRQPLSLTPVLGTDNVYADASGNHYIVQRQDDPLCDPHGCMVKACNATGACSWNYCTVDKCVSIKPPGSPASADKPKATG